MSSLKGRHFGQSANFREAREYEIIEDKDEDHVEGGNNDALIEALDLISSPSAEFTCERAAKPLSE